MRAVCVAAALGLGLSGCGEGGGTTTVAEAAASTAARHSTGATPAPRSTLVVSGPATGHLLVRGVLTRDRRPLPGAKVWLRLMADLPDDAAEGTVVPTWQTRPVLTADDGSYAIELDRTTVPARFLAADAEYLNFEMDVLRDDKLGLWNATSSPRDGGIWRTEFGTVEDPVLRIDMDLGKEPTITQTDSDGEVQHHELPIVDFRG